MQNHTGLRGLLAWWVVLFHAQAITGPLPLIAGGDVAVDIFFLLSGFAIGTRYRTLPPSGWWEYLWRRWLRIYPLHLVTLLGLTLMLTVWSFTGHAYGQPQQLGWWSWLANLALVNAWNVPMQLSWNYPAWSVSAEWLAYLCYPLLAPLLGRWSLWLAMALFGLLLAPLMLWHSWPDLTTVGLLRMALAFPAGVLLARCPWAAPRWGAAIGAIGTVSAALTMPLVTLPFAALLITSLQERSSVLSQPSILAWGERSYALYLTHVPVLIAVGALTQNWPMTLRAGFLLLLTAAVAWAAHVWVDVPLRQWLIDQRFARRRTDQRPAHGD